MTASDDGELVSALVLVVWVPYLIGTFSYLYDVGFRVMTNAEAEVMTFRIIPLILVCLFSWLVMGVGYWIDSGGLDV